MIRVFIADDHAVVRRGLRQMIEETSDMACVGEASNAIEIGDFLPAADPDVLVLDISMPGQSGIELLHDLKRDHSGLEVLILSMHPEDAFAIRAIRSGAGGYVTKDAIPDELLNAIRTIHAGRKFLSNHIINKLAMEIGVDTSVEPHERLSNREFIVFKELVNGLTVTEIAEMLSLSVKTISTYRSRILEKMNMQKTSELIQYARESRLFE